MCRIVYSNSLSLPESTLTPENLSIVLDSVQDDLWWELSRYVNIPEDEQNMITRKHSSEGERKQAIIPLLIATHPALSWKLVANALYQMVIYSDSCHKALDHLQEIFPTGTTYIL